MICYKISVLLLQVVNYLLERGILSEEIADAIEDSTYDLDIWLNRGGKHMVGEWIIAWINECREEYDAEKLREQYELEEYLAATPSSDRSDSEDDYSDSELKELVHPSDRKVRCKDHGEASGCETGDQMTDDLYSDYDQLDCTESSEGATSGQWPVGAGAAGADGAESEELDKSDSEDDDERNDHPPKNVVHGVVPNGEEKTRGEEREMRLTVTVSGATSSQPSIPSLRDPGGGPAPPGSVAPTVSPPRQPKLPTLPPMLLPKLIPIQCSVVPPPGSPGFISHFEKTGLPICPNCTCKLAHTAVDDNDNNCIDLYLSQSWGPAMDVCINTLEKDGPGFIFVLTDCLTQCLPWNTSCRYKVTSSRQPQRSVMEFNKHKIETEVIWQIKVQHHISAVQEVHTNLITYKLQTSWYKCPLKVIVETVSKVAKKFREE